MSSGVGVTVKHKDGDNVYNIVLGLMAGTQTITKDGMPHGYESHATEHIKTYLESLLPSSVKVSGSFPKEIYDADGNISGTLNLPFVSIQGSKGPSREVGVGGILWENNEGTVFAFNQIMYFMFDVFSKNMMKVTQIVDQISMSLQWQKRVGGYLWRRGFQNFDTVQSDPARGFRYDTAWDFRMQHQYSDLFHTRMTIRTSFDVVWLDKTDRDGVISMITFGQTDDIPFSGFLGSQLANIYLEHLLMDWHGNVFG